MIVGAIGTKANVIVITAHTHTHTHTLTERERKREREREREREVGEGVTKICMGLFHSLFL